MKQRRRTRKLQLILEAVRSHRDHPTADQIYLDLRAIDPKISRGTVYRNLKLLVSQGEITQVKVQGAERFDWRLDAHYHLICAGCGKISDAPMQYLEDLDRKLSDETGCRILSHNTLFEGFCSDCHQALPEPPVE